MMTCKNCGAQLADNAVFCSSCGMPVAPAAPVAPLQPETAPVTENTVPVQPEAAPVTENAVPTESADAVQLGVYEAPYQNTQPVNDQAMNNGAPYMNTQPVSGQAVNNGVLYMNGQPVSGQAVNNGVPYMNGQPMNGQPMNNGVPYMNGQQMNGQQMNGQPMNNGMPYQNSYNPYGYQNAVPAQKKKTGLIIGIIAAAIVVIAVVLFCILGSGNRSYKAVTKQYMNGIMKHDLSTMAETIAPESYQDEWLENQLGWDDNEDEFWDSFDEEMGYCGSNVKYRSYVIEEADRMDQNDLADVEDDLLADYDVRANVTDGYELEVVLHVKGDIGTYDREIYLTVIEIKGKWYTYWW